MAGVKLTAVRASVKEARGKMQEALRHFEYYGDAIILNEKLVAAVNVVEDLIEEVSK